jgi:hypothetical protein
MNAEEKARRLAHLTSLTRNDASTVARKRSQIDTVAVGDQSHKRPRRATPTRQSASTNVIDIIELSTTDDERTTDGEETAKSESRPTTKAVCSTSQLPAKHALITTSSLRFSTGAVLLTTAPGKPRPGHISLDDVLERHTLEMAVLSSFTSDTEWLFSKLDIGRTQVILCMHAEEDKVDCFQSLLVAHHSINASWPTLAIFRRCHFFFHRSRVASAACIQSCSCSSIGTISASPFQRLT